MDKVTDTDYIIIATFAEDITKIIAPLIFIPTTLQEMHFLELLILNIDFHHIALLLREECLVSKQRKIDEINKGTRFPSDCIN